MPCCDGGCGEPEERRDRVSYDLQVTIRALRSACPDSRRQPACKLDALSAGMADSRCRARLAGIDHAVDDLRAEATAATDLRRWCSCASLRRPVRFSCVGCVPRTPRGPTSSGARPQYGMDAQGRSSARSSGGGRGASRSARTNKSPRCAAAVATAAGESPLLRAICCRSPPSRPSLIGSAGSSCPASCGTSCRAPSVHSNDGHRASGPATVVSWGQP